MIIISNFISFLKFFERRTMTKLDVDQKMRLLMSPVWRKKDAKEYFGFSQAKMTNVFRNLDEPTNFKKCVYRDDLLKAFGTSVEKEILILKSIESK